MWSIILIITTINFLTGIFSAIYLTRHSKELVDLVLEVESSKVESAFLSYGEDKRIKTLMRGVCILMPVGLVLLPIVFAVYQSVNK